MARVLGIDPGLRITGYGIVDVADDSPIPQPRLVEAGIIKLDARATIEQRLSQLHEDLIGIITACGPTHMAVEKLYAHYAHPRTAILMAHARGVILLAAEQRGIPVEHLPSTEVKKAVTGYGHASKQQMQNAVQSQCNLPEPPSPPDVADAIAIALTCARRMSILKVRSS